MLRVVALIALAGSAMAPALASAAERNFSLRYSNNVNGQITMAANTIMRCPTDTVDPLMNSGCLGAQAGTNARNNNSFDMRWLDVDSDASTFTSSSANLIMPAGSRVLFAGLYWTGLNRTGEAISGANGFKAVPQPPPNAAAIGTVKVKAPGANAYTSVTAAGADVNTASIAVGGGYGAFADVTRVVSAASTAPYPSATVLAKAEVPAPSTLVVPRYLSAVVPSPFCTCAVPPAVVSIDWNEGAAQRFASAMNEDFGTPEAMAVLFDLASEANRTRDPHVAGLLKALGAVLGLLQDDPQTWLQAGAGEGALSEGEIQALIVQRQAAKAAKDFAQADAVRQQLLSHGVVLKDGPQGTTWERV
jgi:hypothetical protein